VVTEIDFSSIKVSWTLPTDNGSPITSYKVFIKEISTDVYTQESVDCDGTNSDVIADKYCLINISTLLAAPYNVDGGDSIYAKVQTANIYGETDISLEGNGAYYTRVPDQLISLTEDNSVRTLSTNGLTWADGVNNGGVPILDYTIKMKEQSEENFATIANGITT
jgi:hypothetical protein